MPFKLYTAGHSHLLDNEPCKIGVFSAGDRDLMVSEGWLQREDFRNARKAQQEPQTSTTQAPEKRKRRKPSEIAEAHERAKAAGVLTDGRRIDAIERELEALEVG